MKARKCLWITDSGDVEQRNVDEIYPIKDGQILVSVRYSGISPSDMRHIQAGMKNLVPGYDYSGVVLKSTPRSAYKPGDLVAGMTPSGVSRGSQCGTHQDIIVAEESMAWLIPPNIPMVDAAGLTLNLRTAIIALYSRLGWSAPSKPSDPGAILVWGAGTQVGTLALQLAVKSGSRPIYVTASSGHHERLARLGATYCFDHSDPGVFDQIKKHIRQSGQPLNYVFDNMTLGHIGDLCYDLVTDPQTAKVVTCGPGSQKAEFFFAMPDWRCDILPPGASEPMWYDKDEPETKVMRDVFQWAIYNYGDGLHITDAKLVKWEDAIEAMKKALALQNRMQKVIIDHGVKDEHQQSSA